MLSTDRLHYTVNSRTIIQDLSLTFFPGQIYGLIGQNGSGKTSLLKLLAGLLTPSQGAVFLNHQNLCEIDRKQIIKHIAFLKGNFSIPYPFSVIEMVQMGQYFSHPEMTSIKNLLEDMNISHLVERSYNTLSDGEKQRVLIAQALANNPSIILCDEPTTHLDAHHCVELWSYFKKLRLNGKTLIVATHDLLNAEKFCDQIITQGTRHGIR